jgi:hypothetical protein
VVFDGGATGRSVAGFDVPLGDTGVLGEAVEEVEPGVADGRAVHAAEQHEEEEPQAIDGEGG